MKAFRAIDSWQYGYIDQSNLKSFLRNTGHIATKQELIAILRRFDMDGDAKINFKEFETGMKSTLTIYGGKTKRTKSSQRINNTASKVSLFKTASSHMQKPSMATPRARSANQRPRKTSKSIGRRKQSQMRNTGMSYNTN